MQKIRITKTPKTGDQRDFSLVHKQAHYINDGETVNPVKNTMGAVPIEQANIEVEGGETVVGDVNRDGFLEHMTFVGKRHSQGGMPVNIPEGSFIFSDTKKLKIKDKEILSKVFGLSAKKGGYTPAEIAKKYQINNYIHDLKSESADPITKRSATQMLANNMEKLGMLALVQESMKGFPDGIPAIAESVMAGLQGGGAEEMPQGKMGGVFKYQQGGQQTTGNKKLDSLIQDYKKNPTKQKADTLKQTIEEAYPESEGPVGSFLFSPFIYSAQAITNPYAQKAWYEANKFEQSQKFKAEAEKKRKTQLERNQDLKNSETTINNLKNFINVNKDQLLPQEQKRLQSYINTINSHRNNINYQFQLKNDMSNINQYVSQLSGDLNKTGFDSGSSKKYKRIIDAKDLTTNNFIKIGQLEDGSWYNTTTGTPVSFNTKMTSLNVEEEEDKDQSAKGKKVSETNTGIKKAPVISKPAVKAKTDAELFESFEQGGIILNKYQDAGTTSEEVFVKTEKNDKGEVRNFYYKGDTKIVKDESGNIIFSGPRTDKAAYAPHKGDVTPSTNPITGQKETGWNKSKYTADQIDALARERGYNGPKNNKALQQWILSKPEFSKVVEELHAKYKVPAAGKKDDGFWGVRWDDILEKIPSVPSTTTTPAPPPGTQPPPTDEGKKEEEKEPAMPQAPKKGPWWLQDITNFVGTLTDDINRYEPTQGRVALQTPGYVTLDPTRRLAANQEQFARMQQMTENTVDGNVGLASMTGTQGQSFANAANVLGDVENANVGIVNQAYNTNAQIMNQEAAANEVGRQKYVEDMATLNQQLDNAEQQNKWRQIAAFNNGTSNWFRKKQMEEVLFPDVYVDPILGDVSVDPSGRSLFGPDTYSPSYMDNRGGNNMMSGNAGIEEWNAIVQEATPIMGPEEAKKYATVYMGNQMRAQNRAVTGLTPRQQYNQMAIQGLTLPLPPREFGGVVYFPWSDIE